MISIKQAIIVAIIALGAICISCSGGSGKSVKKDEVVTLWKQNCSLCHGNDGTLGINGAKDLRLSELELQPRIEIIKKGKGKMIGFEHTLSDKQIEALANYTLTFKN